MYWSRDLYASCGATTVCTSSRLWLTRWSCRAEGKRSFLKELATTIARPWHTYANWAVLRKHSTDVDGNFEKKNPFSYKMKNNFYLNVRRIHRYIVCVVVR